MSKSETDSEYYAPKTGNQQVVFDYLESLLEDPDTLAHDTMEELKAIGALERTEPAVEPVSEEAAAGGAVPETPVLEEPIAIQEAVVDSTLDTEQLVEDDQPAADVFSEPESSLEELELIDTPANLIDAEPEVDSFSAQVEFESEPEPPAAESAMIAKPDIPQASADSECTAVAELAASESEVAAEPIQDVAPVVSPAVDNKPKPALHVAEDVLNCILFELQGLTLAIPVDDVEGAVSMERLTLHFDMDHDWVLGFFDAMGKETSVVDTGDWLLPGRFDASQANYEEVLILKGRRWALACDTLVKSMRMQHSDIVWAGENKSRPWLLGTNMTERCAILDVDKLQMLLNQQA